MHRFVACALLLLLAPTGCDRKTFGGEEIGRIKFAEPGQREQTTLTLAPTAKIALYEDYTQQVGGPGSVYSPEECYRLDVSIEQAGETEELECYPFGGTKSKGVRSTKCFSSSKSGGTTEKAVCRINDCTASLPAGGKTTISATLRSLKPCGVRVTKHEVIIKKVDDD